MGCQNPGKNTNCCGKTVTETQTKVTEYGTDYCKMPKGTLQYTGARYVPVFANPVEWSADRTYEHLMMVQHMGATYISRQAVPVGAQLPAEGEQSNDYWVFLTNWNAQIEQYRQDVERLATELDNEEETRANADTALGTRIDDEATARANADTALGTRIDDEAEARENADDAMSDRLTAVETEYATNIKKAVLIGDSYLREYAGNAGWGGFFETATGFECTRFKSGGAGFIRKGDSDTEAGLNFTEMAEKARTTMTLAERRKVDIVVCQGGINDLAALSPSESEFRGAVNEFCNKARSVFPYARILVCMSMCSKEYMGNVTLNGAVRNLYGSIQGGACLANNSPWWFQNLDFSEYNRGDDIHPSDAGYRFLGRMIARAVDNPDIARPFTMTNNAITDLVAAQVGSFSNWAKFNASEIMFTGEEYQVNLEWEITDASAMPSGAQWFALPIISRKGDRTSTQFIAPATLSDSTDGYSFIPFGAHVMPYNSVYCSNVRVRLNPSFKNLSNNSNITWANGNRVRVNFTIA